MQAAETYDLVILGAGPGGSTLASLMAQRGKKVALVEGLNFPRFRIGESLLPFSTDIFKKTGVMEVLDSGKYIRKYGARFVDGVTEEEVYFKFAEGLDTDHPYCFEVQREDFDKDLLDWAVKSGAKLLQPEIIKSVDFDAEGAWITTDQRKLRSKFVADSTGRDCFLGKKFALKKMNPDINNVGCFSHFTGVRRAPGSREGDISIGLLEKGVWCWQIPFKGELTSVGVVCPAGFFREGDPQSFLKDWLSRSRIFSEDMKNAKMVRPVQVVSNYSHTCDSFFGDRWILVGDAAAFLDPIFSSGVHLSMTAAVNASEALLRAMDENLLLTQEDLGAHYEKIYRKGVKRFHNLIRLFYDQNFVSQMKRAMPKPVVGRSFTSAVAGDVWNDENPIFVQGVL